MGSHLHGSMDEQMVMVEQGKRRLTRCFVVLKVPPAPSKVITEKEDPRLPMPKRTNSGNKTPTNLPNGPGKRTVPRSPSSTSAPSVPFTGRIRPPLSSSSSRSSVFSTDSTRTRTTSLTSPSFRSSPQASSQFGLDNKPPLVRSNSARKPIPPGLVRSGSYSGFRRPGLSSPRPSLLAGSKSHSSIPRSPSIPDSRPEAVTPFYISPIHLPSTHPRFLDITPENDFAPWLTIEESASQSIELEVWYEAEEGWRKLDALSGVVDLARFRRTKKDGKRPDNTKLPDNTLQLTVSSDPEPLFYLPHGDSPNREHGGRNVKARETVHGVVERSLRETRMKQGVGVGGLHQYVYPHSLISLTKQTREHAGGHHGYGTEYQGGAGEDRPIACR